MSFTCLETILPARKQQPAELAAAASSSFSGRLWRRWGWAGGTPRSAHPPGSLSFRTSPWNGRLPRCWGEPAVWKKSTKRYITSWILRSCLEEHYDLWIHRVHSQLIKNIDVVILFYTLPFFFLETTSASSSPSSISLRANSLFTFGSFCFRENKLYLAHTRTERKWSNQFEEWITHSSN